MGVWKNLSGFGGRLQASQSPSTLIFLHISPVLFVKAILAYSEIVKCKRRP